MIEGQLPRWRQAIEAIDLCAEDARQRLNQLYTEIINQLRQEFQAATFTVAAPSLGQKRAAEAADPDTQTERLWELISHHPGEVTANSLWTLLILGGAGLIGKNEHINEEQLFPFAQVEGFWQDVHRRHKEDYYDKLLLSYTALLPLEKHPFHAHPLIRALYAAGDVLSTADLKSLALQTDELDSYGEGMLQQVRESLGSPDDPDFPLPEILRSPIVDDLLLALAPVFSEGDELFEIVFNRRWGNEGVFLDASPLAEQLLSFSKTKLVERGVRVDTNTLMPAEVYERLALHRNSGPQSEVAGCIHTPAEVFEQLASSSSKEIIYPLASNPMTPLPVLRQLMSWGGWGAKTVQSYVEANPAYTGGEAWQLMEMDRLQLQTDQRKKDALLACLQLLSSQPDPLDGLRLVLNASIWARWRLEPSTLRLRMIQKGWASEELMLAAAWSWHWLERLAVAKSPLAPAMALTKLQSDGLAFIRHAALQPRRSLAEAASAVSPSGWIEQLAALAASDPVACVRDPRFAEWLDQDPDHVASLLSKQHRTILAETDLPPAYFCWCLSQLSEREKLRMLMHREVPQDALDQLVRYDAKHAKLTSQVPEKRQGDLAGLAASSAASHLNQSNPELIRCSRAELENGDHGEVMPQEIAFFVMGFYNPTDICLLNTADLLKLLIHPVASPELLRHLGKELDDRRDTRDEVVYYHTPGSALRNAVRAYTFNGGEQNEFEQLKLAGQLLGLEGISDGLRSWFISLVADLADQVFGDRARQPLTKSMVDSWPAVLPAKDTRKLLASKDVNRRLVAVCFGDLNEEQMETMASDAREEVRFAFALLRSCPALILERLAADSNGLVRKASRIRSLRQQESSGGTRAVPSNPESLVEWPANHASDTDLDRRAGLSLHPQCPLPVLIQLLDDQQKICKYGAFNNLTIAEVAATSPALATFRDPASYETAALALLRSTKPSSRARRLALRSPHCPLKLLSRYATSLDWRERHAVASHPNTPTRLLKALIQDANQHVAQAAVNRRSEEMSSNP